MRHQFVVFALVACVGLAGCASAQSDQLASLGPAARVQQPSRPPADIKPSVTKAASPKCNDRSVSLDQYGTNVIVVDTDGCKLYYVNREGAVRTYPVGVGREGFEWAGQAYIKTKQKWPSWTPPKEMLVREARNGRHIPNHMEGGIKNPLGARALYLFDAKNKNKDTYYRIHGTNDPKSIGQKMSSGCIRMMNNNVIELYTLVDVGTPVVVLR